MRLAPFIALIDKQLRGQGIMCAEEEFMSRSKDDIMAEIRQLQSEMAQYDDSYAAAGTKEN